jgi:hypothetical protein
MASEIQIRQKQMEKAWRSQIRLSYSLMADAEIERNREEFSETIQRALSLGQTVQLTPAQVTIDGRAVEAIVSGNTDNS